MTDRNTDRNTEGNNEKFKTRSWLIFFTLFVIVLALAIYYFSEIKKEVALLEKVKPYWLLVAAFGQFMTYFIAALIYRSLLKVYHPAQLPERWDLLKASIVSLFFNQTVPSAGMSGNAFLFNFLSRFNMARAQIVSLILSELLIFYAAMESIILSLLIACLWVYRSLYAFKSTLAAGMLVYAAFGLLIILAGRKQLINRLYEKITAIKWLKKIIKGVDRRLPVKEVAEEEGQWASLLKNNRPVVVKCFFLQLLIVAADVSTLYVLFIGAGQPAALFVVLLTLISTKIISILPFLPGALVLYESSMSFFFVNAGVPVGTAIIVTLVYRLLSFWLPMPLGAFLYRKWLKDPARRSS